MSFFTRRGPQAAQTASGVVSDDPRPSTAQTPPAKCDLVSCYSHIVNECRVVTSSSVEPLECQRMGAS